MRGLLSGGSRAALAAVIFLLALAVLRWPPVFAHPPLDVRALPLFAAAVLLATLAALTGREPRPTRVRPLAWGLAGAALALAALVAIRPPAGLPVRVSGPAGALATLAPGPIEIHGPRLRAAAVPAVRKWTFDWEGELRAPATGTYRLWAEGRGHVRVILDGHPVLEGEGEPLRAGADVPLQAGAHRLQVVLARTGPGPRLRLGWTRPDRHGRPLGLDEAIPPRLVGPPTPAWTWVATDVLALIVAGLGALLVWRAPWDRPRRPPPPGPITRREIAWSLAAHAVLVSIMSWPLVLDLSRSGVMDRPDGRLNAWILAWDAHALTHAPARLFQAPIFHPLPDTLAFSENLLVPAILAAPATLLGGPVLGYNLVLLLSMVVSGLGTQLLVRRASGDSLAAFVGGAVFAVGAHRWIRLAHLHAQVTLFLPFALLALDAFWQKRTWRRALAVGLLLALQALSSIYLGAITALALAAATAVAILGGLRGSDLLKLAAGLGLAAVLVAPAMGPYLRMRALHGIEWTLADVATYATTLESYAASGTRLYGSLTQRHLAPERVQDTLFPGVVPLVLGLAGLAVAPRRYRAVAIVASVAAVVFSLGPQTALYRALHENLVLVRGVRALSRFSLVPVLALSVLSGLALARRWRLALLALPLVLLESSNLPNSYARVRAPPPSALWLAGGEGAVLHLPAGEGDTQAMLDGALHWRPLVNGDSGFVPRPYARLRELLDRPLDGEPLRLLRAIGARHVVSASDEPLPLAAALGADRVYSIPPGDTAATPAPEAGPSPTLWSGEAVVVDLGAPRSVGRVMFELDDRPWVDEPTVEMSTDGTTWTAVGAQASLADATLALYRDPRRGRGEVRFRATTARWIRLDPRLPARPGALAAAP
ncbi:MAG TPA: PA14 domain-containing protein [Vicinamibacteria bacterium]|nr:PA14 domain-containing protein [Vicinamibacteria bacterium]